MKRLPVIATALCFAVAGPALANSESAEKKMSNAPVAMTEAQMDNVVGGLITAILVDVVDINNNKVQVAVPVNAAVAAGILGNAGAIAVQRPGRQQQ